MEMWINFMNMWCWNCERNYFDRKNLQHVDSNWMIIPVSFSGWIIIERPCESQISCNKKPEDIIWVTFSRKIVFCWWSRKAFSQMQMTLLKQLAEKSCQHKLCICLFNIKHYLFSPKVIKTFSKLKGQKCQLVPSVNFFPNIFQE